MDIDTIMDEMAKLHIKSTFRTENTVWVVDEKGTTRPATAAEEDLHRRLIDILDREDMLAEAMEVQQELRESMDLEEEVA